MAGDGPITTTPVDYETGLYRQRSLVAALISTGLISITFICLRFYSRARLTRSVGLDDWVVAVAGLFSAVLMALALTGILANALGKRSDTESNGIGAVNGAGVASKAIILDDIVLVAKMNWLNNALYWIVLLLTKLSILILYGRILSYSRISVIVHVLMAFVIAISIAGFVVAICFCLPVHAMWDPTVVSRRCVPLNAAWVLYSIHIFTDFVIVSLPLPMVVTLHMPRQKKRSLYLVFCLGYIICIIGLTRLVLLIHISNVQARGEQFNTVIAAICTTVEIHGGIVIACLMTLRPLVTRFFPGWDLSTAGKSDPKASGPMSRPRFTAEAAVTRRTDEHDMAYGYEEDDMVLMPVKDGHIVSEQESTVSSGQGVSWLKLDDQDDKNRY